MRRSFSALRASISALCALIWAVRRSTAVACFSASVALICASNEACCSRISFLTDRFLCAPSMTKYACVTAETMFCRPDCVESSVPRRERSPLSSAALPVRPGSRSTGSGRRSGRGCRSGPASGQEGPKSDNSGANSLASVLAGWYGMTLTPMLVRGAESDNPAWGAWLNPAASRLSPRSTSSPKPYVAFSPREPESANEFCETLRRYCSRAISRLACRILPSAPCARAASVAWARVSVGDCSWAHAAASGMNAAISQSARNVFMRFPWCSHS